MAERRSRRRKREDEESEDDENEANDEQTEVAKYLRFNCETKSSNYHSQKVEYFKGSKAIDCLLDSKWASGKGGTEILFTDRESVQDYLETLLELGMFKRVTRVRKKKKGDKDEGKKSTKDNKDSPKPGKGKKDTNEDKNGESGGKKIKVKVKLELHDYQEFLDGEEVYMWIFDPVHPRTIIYGVLVVIGAIVICLFPLWPAQMREYTWYLSVGAAVLLGALLVLALFRYVLFAFVWAVTNGRHHFWLLPNLTEDCGVLESFLPLYTHNYVGANGDDDGKTGETKDSNNGTVEDEQESVEDNKDKDEDNKNNDKNKDDEENKDNEENNDIKGEKDEDRSSERPEGEQEQSPATTRRKEGNESESWINVTDEDVAQAKEATHGNESDTKTITSPVTC